MATEQPRHSTASSTDTDHSNCLLTPMGRNGDPPIQAQHVIDAALVGTLTFTAVILVDVIPALLAGQAAFLTPAEIVARAPTAAIGALLAFVFQWLRARGIDALEYVNRLFPD